MKSSIWVERYRPKSLNDIIFQDERQARQFKTFVDNGDIPNLLLSGIQGTGKTTLSKALIHELDIDRSDVLRINCSDEKIDAMRNKVTAFATTLPLGKFKVVQLEELDYLSLDAQALLRGLIEDTSLACRYIATCNYDNRVIPPLKSRFQQFSFKAPNKEAIALRLADILEAERVQYDPEHLLSYVDVGYPDIRKTIQLLQGNVQEGALLPPGIGAGSSDWKFGLLDALNAGDFKRARKLVCESSSKEEHEDIYRFLYENVDKMKVADRDEAILVIAEHLYKHSIVADTEINLAACFISLGKL